jgi:hypothetical protein
MPATVKIHWTEAEDAHLLTLRAQGYTNQQIADSVGRPRTTIGHRLVALKAQHSPENLAELRWDRLMLLLQRKQGLAVKPGPLDRKTSGRADFMRRPCGPTPAKPDASPHPREPAWRRCLGDECGRVFWSQSAGVRICPRCKGAGNETVRSGTGEFCLHL